MNAMDSLSTIILPSNNDSELEKLRSANQLANQLLERSKENYVCMTNHDAETVRNKKLVKPSRECTQGAEKLGEIMADSTHDNWGAMEFLQSSDHFNFVTDYLNRTEKLLNKTNPANVLSTSRSYKIVSSSDELLQNVDTALMTGDGIDRKHTAFFEDHNTHDTKISLLPQDQSNTKSKDFPVSFVFQNECRDSNLNPADAANELVTHRPGKSIEQLNVFTPVFEKECQKQDFAPPNERCKRIQTLDAFDTSQSNNDGFQRKPPTQDLSLTVDASEKKPKRFENAWSTTNSMKLFNKTTEEFSNSLPVTLQVNQPTITHGVPQTSRSPLLSMLLGSPSSSDMLLESTDHEENKLDHENVEDTTNKKVNDSILLNAQETEETLSLNQDIDDASDLCQLSKECYELNIPRLPLSDKSDTEAHQPIVKRGAKTRIHGSMLPVKPRQRPASAGHKRVLPVTNNTFMEDFHEVPISGLKETSGDVPILSKKSPEKSKRPASAGKLQAILRSNTSPKRVWEKSSIAWASYGKGQLSTWSSVNLSPSKLPTANGSSATLKENPNSKIHKVKSNSRHVVNLFAHAMLQPLQKVWLQLPDEILIHIFTFLPLKDVLNVAKVCKRFNQISGDSQLWKRVAVSGMTLTNQWLMSIGRKCSQSISLTNCCGKGVTEIGLRNFFKNSKFDLTHLHVGNCSGGSLSGDSVLLHASCHCRKLTHVSIPWSKTTDNGIMAICLALPALESLNITGNPAVTDEAFQVLNDKLSKSLKFLEMAGCFAVSNDALVSLIKRTSSLQMLNIGLCNKVTTDGIKLLSDHLPMLSHLDLRGIKSVTNNSLHCIATKCKRLRTLVISNCVSISDVGLAEISTYLNSLNHLDISGCSLVSDQGITNFISNAQSIEYLDLSSTGATHVSVDMLIECNHETIEVLKLSFCNNITQSCLMNLLNVAVKLKSLHLYGCKRLKLSALMKVNKNVVVEK